MRKSLLFIFVFAFSGVVLMIASLGLSAQSVVVMGTVTDASNDERLCGAAVIIKRSQTVSTDIDGEFRVNAAIDDTLVISFIGYEKQEVKVSQKHLYVEMKVDTPEINIGPSIMGYYKPFAEFSPASGQTISEIISYADSIDKLREENKLIKRLYPNMSSCGGGLDGYYLDEELVLIDATYGAELGFSSRTCYIRQEIFLKIVYHEHFAEWEKYEQNYPYGEYPLDSAKMTYTDTVYQILNTSPITLYKNGKKESTYNNDKIQELLIELINCGKAMREELLTIE